VRAAALGYGQANNGKPKKNPHLWGLFLRLRKLLDQQFNHRNGRVICCKCLQVRSKTFNSAFDKLHKQLQTKTKAKPHQHGRGNKPQGKKEAPTEGGEPQGQEPTPRGRGAGKKTKQRRATGGNRGEHPTEEGYKREAHLFYT